MHDIAQGIYHYKSTQRNPEAMTLQPSMPSPPLLGLTAYSPVPSPKKTDFEPAGKGTQNPSDDGTDICETLGLPCTSIDRRSFEYKPLTHEIYYWAGLDNNTDLNLLKITDHINAPSLLLTGNLGDDLVHPRRYH